MRTGITAALLCLTTTLALAAPARANPTAGNFRYAIDSAVSASDFASAGRDDVIILQAYQDALATRIKATSPGTKVLMYMDLSALATRDQWGHVATGVTTQDAAAHPDWYLLNTSNQRFTFSGYGWLWAADIGKPAFQQKWADNVISELKTAPWDGVFMDDTNPTMSGHYSPSQVAAYPNDAAYTAATRSALAAISTRLHAAGELLVPNMGAMHSYPRVMDDWLQFVDGFMEEHFTKWETPAGTGYMTGADWQAALDEVKAVGAAGKLFLGVSRSSGHDADAARFGFATMLLAANGHANFAMHDNYTGENWFPEYDADLGVPTGPEHALPSGVHERVFAQGLVLVNPTTAAISVPLDRAYSGSGLTVATSVRMEPHTGLVLRRDAFAVPPAANAGGDTAPVAKPRSDQSSEVQAPTVPAAPAPLVAPTTTTTDGGLATPITTTTATGSRRDVKVTCRSQKPCKATVSLRRGGRAVAAKAVRVSAGRSRTVTFRVARVARRRLVVVVRRLNAGRAEASPRTLTA